MGDLSDHTYVGQLLGSWDFTQAQIASYDQQLASMGFALPPPWDIVLIGNPQPLSGYQWRVRACAGQTCSDWSPYTYWLESIPWPF